MKKINYLIAFSICNVFCQEDTGQEIKERFIFPLFSFGQNIVKKNETFASFAGYFRKGPKIAYDRNFLSLLYGLTDRLSLLLSLPVIDKYKINKISSAGAGDFYTQLEYAFYRRELQPGHNMATVIANIAFPTGSAKKIPPVGYGSPSFFLGFTVRHMGYKWYLFNSQGGIITTSKNRTRFGSTYFYEFGLGNKIISGKDWIIEWFCEINGIYEKKDKIRGVTDPNSGGNTIFFAPVVLWVAVKQVIIEVGAQFPVLQNLNGVQNPYTHSIGFNLIYEF